MPANGVGAPAQLSNDAKVLRWDGVPSPDGNYVANHDKNQRLWMLDVAKKTQKQVAESANGDFDDIAWSPDSRWLAYTAPAPNQLTRIFLYEVATGAHRPGHLGPLRQLEPGVEPGRQVALLPVEPELRVAGRQPVGIAAA